MNEIMDEQKLVQIYSELTGASESRARSVYMLVFSEVTRSSELLNPVAVRPLPLQVEQSVEPTVVRERQTRSLAEMTAMHPRPAAATSM